MRGLASRLALLLTSIAFGALLLELGCRALFTWKAGPSALVYGTRFARVEVRGDLVEVVDSLRWDELIAVKDKGTAHLDSEIGTYSKYHPRQYQSLYVVSRGKPATLATPAGIALYPVTANNHGFRGPDFSQAKPPGVARVVTLGASSTYGYRNRDHETYPFYLQRYLNQALAVRTCGDVASFEVLNLGIPHLDASNIHALFVAEVLDLAPDVVTFYEGANETRRIQRSLHQRWLIDLASVSVFAKFLTFYWESQLESFSESDLRHHAAGRSEFFLEHVSGIADECRKRDVLFIIASQLAKSLAVPRKFMGEITHAQEVALVEKKLADGERLAMSELLFLIHAEIMRSLEAWAQANDVPYVDLIRTFDERGVRDGLLTWVHLSAKANRLVAAELGDAILERLCAAQRTSTPSG